MLLKIFLLVTFCVLICATEEEFSGRRIVKRRVLFSKSSKLFFRLNGKATSVNFTDIFAVGWAIRINYDLPETLPKRHTFFKRNVHNDVESFRNKPAFRGLSCVLKHLCEIISRLKFSNTCGMFCDIGKIITNSETMEADFFKSFTSKCDLYSEFCPDDFTYSTF